MSSDKVPVEGDAVFTDEGTPLGLIDSGTEAEWDEDTESWEVEVAGSLVNIEWDETFNRWQALD